MRFTLPKSEILRGFGSFTRVITEGKSISRGPVRCYYCRTIGHPTHILAGFSVSRSVRRAVDRNKARRAMRESYRLARHLLGGQNDAAPPCSFEIVFMFTGRSIDIRRGTLSADVSNSMQHIMKAIAREEA